MMGDAIKVEQPAFTVDQLVPASQAANNFGDLRKEHEMNRSLSLIMAELTPSLSSISTSSECMLA